MTKYHGLPMDAYDRRYVRMTREEALTCGQHVYWSEGKCKHGHIGWKYVNKDCVTCKRRASANALSRRYDRAQGDARKKAERLRDDRELTRLESLHTFTLP